ncbi:uncharacterized protein LOC133795584 [Humulus lupulus]|uniref:uncharacterized protein LOC133795584 n=1 Tax=Humulus lupulus TaxID=3486 RepID=UPI002B40377D|nr:uncharacterized protein LOC133795584 [Humulus lupulus]
MEDFNMLVPRMSTINLAEEDEGGLDLQGNIAATEEVEPGFNWRLALIGRFIQTGSFDFPSMQQTLASIWRPGKGVFIKELDNNRFLFQFYHELDIKRVVEGSPWYFNRKALIISRMNEDVNPRCVPLNSLDLWVQIHDLQTGFMKYENVPSFCFICGLLGHSERFCPRRFDTPEDELVQPYGEWMRAPLRRQTKLIGAQWLRTSISEELPSQSTAETSPAIATRPEPPADAPPDFSLEIHGYSPTLQDPTNRGYPLRQIGEVTSSQSQRASSSQDNEKAREFNTLSHGPLVTETKKRRTVVEMGRVEISSHPATHITQMDRDEMGREGIDSHLMDIAPELHRRDENMLANGVDVENSSMNVDHQEQEFSPLSKNLDTAGTKDKVDRIRNSLGFEGMIVVEAQGHSGGLAILWRHKEEAQLLSFGKNHIDVIITTKDRPTHRLTGVYGEPNRARRASTWRLLRHLADSSPLPWCVIGDLNNTLTIADKRGGRPYPSWLLQGFQEAINDCGLVDVELTGYQFTWDRGRGSDHWVECRLDRALVNSAWLHLFPRSLLINVAISTSDHCPILLDPVPIIEEVWWKDRDAPVLDKIALCAEALQEWGKSITGNFKQRMDRCKATIKRLKPFRDRRSIQKHEEASKELFEILTQKEVFWRQRSKQLWLREGDHNSRYFHAAARTRKRTNNIHSLYNESNQLIEWNNGLQELMVEYFQTLFKSTVPCWDPVVSCITRAITPDQNLALLSPIGEEEVNAAIFQMHPDKSPGPDGMSPGFYQKYWHIVGSDVVNEVRRFWNEEKFADQLPLTNIVLVPKKKSPVSMLDLRPISLCNVLYKIISKVLANRLKQVIDDIISETQSAFIPGRLITDNIMISYELMHYMKRKTTGKQGYMALKLDMSKAYDRVEWDYLQAVLRRMGFDEKLVKLFMACITSARYQIVHAGKVFGHIIPERGLRQGDPLSSYLFIICTEGFSALLQDYEEKKLLNGIQVARGAPKVSHMFFADDSYIFCKASTVEAHHVLQLLGVFEKASGQKINYDKSSIFYSRNTSIQVRDTICGDMGIHEADDNSTYLGLPNILGRNKSVILGYLKDRIRIRIQNWESRFLSKAGKEILLKTVAQALPNYAMSVFLLPLATSRDIERLMNRYWWSSSSKKSNGIHWQSWSRLSKPKESGGLGFRSLYDFNLALLGKQGWRLLQQPQTLVSRLYKARYYPHTSFLSATIGGSPSYIWRSILASQELIRQGAAVRIGDGQSINVLEVPWLPSPDPYVHTNSSVLVNKKVAQLMTADQREWDEDLLQDLFIDRDVGIIRNIPIQAEIDTWFWKLDRLGHYTVKSAHSWIQKKEITEVAEEISVYWKRLWKLGIPPKVKSFLWQASTNCLPTKCNLQFKGISVNALCPFCNSCRESTSHVLFSCSFSQVCWNLLGVQIDPDDPGVFADHFAKLLDSTQADNILLIPMLCWALWKSRNELIWNQKGAEAFEIVTLARITLEQWKNAQDRSFDLSLGFAHLSDGAVKWQPPRPGTIKINTDAALFVGPDRFSFAVVACNHEGSLLEAKASCVGGLVEPDFAEALGIREALSWIKTKDWHNVEVESDSLVSIQAIRSSSVFLSYFGRIIQDCRRLLLDLIYHEVSIKFVKRSANAVTHSLAKTTSIISDRIVFRSAIPPDMNCVLLNDLLV